jgi:hypothetical protein
MATRSPPTFAPRAQLWSASHHLKEDQATWSVELWQLSQTFLLFALYLPKHHILNDDFNLRPATLIF